MKADADMNLLFFSPSPFHKKQWHYGYQDSMFICHHLHWYNLTNKNLGLIIVSLNLHSTLWHRHFCPPSIIKNVRKSVQCLNWLAIFFLTEVFDVSSVSSSSRTPSQSVDDSLSECGPEGPTQGSLCNLAGNLPATKTKEVCTWRWSKYYRGMMGMGGVMLLTNPSTNLLCPVISVSPAGQGPLDRRS